MHITKRWTCWLLGAWLLGTAAVEAQAPASPPSGRAAATPPSRSRRSRRASTTRCPTEAEIKAVLDRIRDHFVRATPYRIIDTATGQPITDFTTPIKTAGIDTEAGRVQRLDVLDGRRARRDDAGDRRHRRPGFQAYAIKNFDFIFDAPAVLPAAGQGVRPAERGATAGCSTCANSTTAAPSARR